VVAFTETLAHEIAGRGVRVACVCPPIVDTPLLSQVREGAADLVASQKAIRPEVVLDAVEAGIDKGTLFVFPTLETRATVWVRKLAPGLIWKRMADLTASARRPPTGSDAAAADSPPAAG
jgi:short-subunit dehydrogenase